MYPPDLGKDSKLTKKLENDSTLSLEFRISMLKDREKQYRILRQHTEEILRKRNQGIILKQMREESNYNKIVGSI